MSGYGEGVCIDCGTASERLLHPGFPHICSRCLFPQALQVQARKYARRREGAPA